MCNIPYILLLHHRRAFYRAKGIWPYNMAILAILYGHMGEGEGGRDI